MTMALTLAHRLHAFFLVVPIRSSLHVLMVVAVISCFQQFELSAHGLAMFDVNLAHSFAKTPRCDLN